ncbi:MAG: dihydrofolate reductase [Eubacterium sp.]|nr:dihydrofolate reductase [Eubacterium sp.]MCR5628959.1 dihydrofolate reductase [Eubacterium sp.]
MPFTDVMYITEVNTIIEDGDVFFSEFDENDFDVTTSETGGDEIKFTRKIYRRKR